MKLGLEQALLTRPGTVYMQTLGAVATMVTQYSTGLRANAAVKQGMSACSCCYCVEIYVGSAAPLTTTIPFCHSCSHT